MADKLVAFFRANSPFSNFYRVTFTYRGHTFKSSEQAFMWAKAETFHDTHMAKLILAAPTPRQAKRHGRAVRGYNDVVWSNKRMTIMNDVLYAKFSQNASICKTLIDTKGATLVEASPFDRIWGIGLSQTHPHFHDRTRWGQNLLGKCLEQVRQMVAPEQFMVTTAEWVHPV